MILEIRLKIQKKFDENKNILINLNSLVTISSLKAKKLINIIFENNSHKSIRD